MSGFNKINMNSRDSLDLEKLSEEDDEKKLEYGKTLNHAREVSLMRLDDYIDNHDVLINSINFISPSFLFGNNSLKYVFDANFKKSLSDEDSNKTVNFKNLQDTTIILNADNLEKKSKLRSFFEKTKSLVCIPFYPDNDQTLSKLAYNFLKNKKISISPSNINLIVNKCSGDREALINELQKIEFFSKNGKKINSENISKLINLNENHSISELIDNCLAQNKKKIISILNENNFSNEDCIMIVRSFINKSKKLLALSKAFETNKNIDLTISSAKPPIFWKEKEITKQQILKWSSKNIKQLIYSISETELQIKKNINNSINLITDFILFQSSSATNN